MTFYDAFVDEIEKIAKEKEDSTQKALSRSGLALGGVGIAGLGAEAAGEISKHKHYGKGTRPKWSHPAKKWGRRAYRGSMAALFPAAVYSSYRRYKNDKEKGK